MMSKEEHIAFSYTIFGIGTVIISSLACRLTNVTELTCQFGALHDAYFASLCVRYVFNRARACIKEKIL